MKDTHYFPDVRLAVLRDLKSERRVSMERYADELVTMANQHEGWTARGFVLPEDDVGEVKSAIDRLRRYYRRYVAYRRYAGNLDADLFHIADHAFASLIGNLPSHRTIVTCHDIIGLTQREWRGQVSWSPAIPLLHYSVSFLKRAARVIAVSENTKHGLITAGLANEDQIVVVPPPVSPLFSPVWKSARDETRLRLGIDNDAIVLLHVSSPNPYKNLPMLIDVLALLRSRGVPALLLRVGRVFPKEVHQRSVSAGVSEWVRQLGFLPDEEVAKIYGASDMLFFPSLTEGFGWPVVEAMASGLPVIASTADSITESLSGAGLQASALDSEAFADHVTRLIEDTELHAELARKGLQRAKAFSRETVGWRLRETYDLVLES